jgi:hypothetical protein
MDLEKLKKLTLKYPFYEMEDYAKGLSTEIEKIKYGLNYYNLLSRVERDQQLQKEQVRLCGKRLKQDLIVRVEKNFQLLAIRVELKIWPPEIWHEEKIFEEKKKAQKNKDRGMFDEVFALEMQDLRKKGYFYLWIDTYSGYIDGFFSRNSMQIEELLFVIPKAKHIFIEEMPYVYTSSQRMKLINKGIFIRVVKKGKYDDESKKIRSLLQYEATKLLKPSSIFNYDKEMNDRLKEVLEGYNNKPLRRKGRYGYAPAEIENIESSVKNIFSLKPNFNPLIKDGVHVIYRLRKSFFIYHNYIFHEFFSWVGSGDFDLKAIWGVDEDDHDWNSNVKVKYAGYLTTSKALDLFNANGLSLPEEPSSREYFDIKKDRIMTTDLMIYFRYKPKVELIECKIGMELFPVNSITEILISLATWIQQYQDAEMISGLREIWDYYNTSIKKMDLTPTDLSGKQPTDLYDENFHKLVPSDKLRTLKIIKDSSHRSHRTTKYREDCCHGTTDALIMVDIYFKDRNFISLIKEQVGKIKPTIRITYYRAKTQKEPNYSRLISTPVKKPGPKKKI